MEESKENPTQNRGKGGRGGRGRGNRGNRGGNRGGQQNRGEGRQNRKNDPANAPKDSYYYKFYFGPFPEIEKVTVTLDTEVPEPLPKEQILPEPSRDEYIEELKKVDEQIEKKREQKEAIIQQKKDIITARKDERAKEMENPENKQKQSTFKDVLQQKRDLVQKLRDMSGKTKDLQKKQADILAEQNTLKKYFSEKYRSAEAVQKRIQFLEKQLVTTSLKAADERANIKETDFLRRSLEYVEQYDALKPKLDAIKDELKPLYGQQKKLRDQIGKYNTQLDQMNEDFRTSQQLREENKEELDKLSAKIDAVKEEIQKLFEKKGEIKEQHFKLKFEHKCQNQQIKHIEYIKRTKERLEKQEEYKKQKEEEALAKRESIPNPYEQQIADCQWLSNYLKKIKRDHENATKQTLKQEEQKVNSEEAKEALMKQVKDQKIEMYQPQSKEEGTTYIGGKKGGKKGRKNKQKANQKVADAQATIVEEGTDKLNLNFEILRSFATVKVQAPSTVAEIDDVVAKLLKSAEEFESQGEQEISEGMFDADRENPEDSHQQKPRGGKRQQKPNFSDDKEFPALGE